MQWHLNIGLQRQPPWKLSLAFTVASICGTCEIFKPPASNKGGVSAALEAEGERGSLIVHQFKKKDFFFPLCFKCRWSFPPGCYRFPLLVPSRVQWGTTRALNFPSDLLHAKDGLTQFWQTVTVVDTSQMNNYMIKYMLRYIQPTNTYTEMHIECSPPFFPQDSILKCVVALLNITKGCSLIIKEGIPSTTVSAGQI